MSDTVLNNGVRKEWDTIPALKSSGGGPPYQQAIATQCNTCYNGKTEKND